MDVEVLRRLFEPDAAGTRALLATGPRGCGKTWWARQAQRYAGESGFATTVVDVRSGEGQLALASTERVGAQCIIIDDVHLADDALRAALQRLLLHDGSDHPIVAMLTAATSAAFGDALAVRIEPLGDDELVAVLESRAVGRGAALRCAAAAGGNPGLAIALADGLSPAQRQGLAPVPDLPRLAADSAAALHDGLRALGERTCRALMVAAATHDGDISTIAPALDLLGEPTTGIFDDAERHGIVDVVGSQVVFVDPWMRLAAYHLLAPASRRAAHRALAASLGAPRQAVARARHLLAALDGPSDDVAEALLAVAMALRVDARHEALRLSQQAAAVAAHPEVRERCTVRAIAVAVDSGALGLAADMCRQLDAADPSSDAATAIAEVGALVGGPTRGFDPGGTAPAANGTTPPSRRDRDGWSARRARRIDTWRRAEAGDHVAVLRDVDAGSGQPVDLWARAVALRHAGLTRDAIEAAERLVGAIDDRGLPSPSALSVKATVLAADLDLLAGRFDRAEQRCRDLPDAATLEVRARLAAAMSCSDGGAGPVALAALTHAVGMAAEDEPLRHVRQQLADAVASRDGASLRSAIDAAEAANLPIETAEAHLAMAAFGPMQHRADSLAAARSMVQRCAVRLWDAWIAALDVAAPGDAGSAAPRALDALSAAERRVAEAVASGLTNRDVAATLFLSVKTVDFHLQQIYRKLDIRSRTELAVKLLVPSTAASPGGRR